MLGVGDFVRTESETDTAYYHAAAHNCNKLPQSLSDMIG